MRLAPLVDQCFGVEFYVLHLRKEVSSNFRAVVLLGVNYYWGYLGRGWWFIGGRIMVHHLFGGIIIGACTINRVCQIRIYTGPQPRSSPGVVHAYVGQKVLNRNIYLNFQ